MLGPTDAGSVVIPGTAGAAASVILTGTLTGSSTSSTAARYTRWSPESPTALGLDAWSTGPDVGLDIGLVVASAQTPCAGSPDQGVKRWDEIGVVAAGG